MSLDNIHKRVIAWRAGAVNGIDVFLSGVVLIAVTLLVGFILFCSHPAGIFTVLSFVGCLASFAGYVDPADQRAWLVLTAVWLIIRLSVQDKADKVS